MGPKIRSRFEMKLILALTLALLAACTGTPADYQEGPASRDGTGRYWLGREIARTMSHEGAGWLDRDSREFEERTDLLLASLPLEPGDVVADFGAGSGYFTVRLAPLVPQGRVLAVDIQPEMLAIIAARLDAPGAAKRLDNIEMVLAGETDPNLPPSAVDLVLMVDTYHEISAPREVMAGVVEALKPGGLLALVEYRAEDPAVAIKPLHKMTERQARREMAAAGLVWERTIGVLPQQHLMLFRKPG